MLQNTPSASEAGSVYANLDTLDTCVPTEWTDEQWKIFFQLVDAETARAGWNAAVSVCEHVYCLDVALYLENRQRITGLKEVPYLLIQEYQHILKAVINPENQQEKIQSTRMTALRFFTGSSSMDYAVLRQSAASKLAFQLHWLRPETMHGLFDDTIANFIDIFDPSEDGRLQDFVQNRLREEMRQADDKKKKIAPVQAAREKSSENRNQSIFKLRQKNYKNIFALAESLQADSRVNTAEVAFPDIKTIAFHLMDELATTFIDESMSGNFWEWAEEIARTRLAETLSGKNGCAKVKKHESIPEKKPLNPDVLLEQEFSRLEQQGWKRSPHFQEVFRVWFQSYSEEILENYRQALWAFIRTFKDTILTNIAAAIQKDPHLNTSLLIPRALQQLVKGADHFNPSGDMDPEDFVNNGFQTVLKRLSKS